MKILVSLPLLLCLGMISQSSAIAFYFKPFNSPNSCMVQTGGGFSVVACDANNNNQKFTEILSSTVLTTLLTGQTVACNALALDAVPGTAPNGAATNLVKQEAWNPGSKTQYWIQTLPTNTPLALPGYVWFKNFGTGGCMTAESNGGYIDTYACTSGALHQVWSVGAPNAAMQSESTLTNQQTNLLLAGCLKVQGGSPYPDAPAVTAACAATEFSQNFFPFNRTASVYQILNTNTCVDGGGSANNIYPYPCTPTALNHQWMRFTYPTEDISPYVYFMDLLSGLCLTWDPLNLPWIKTTTCSQGNTNQQWQTYFTA